MYFFAFGLRKSIGRSFLSTCAAVITISLANPVASQDLVKLAYDDGKSTGDIVRVEEDWELVVTDPDPNSSGPQVNCLMSPYANANSLYATFEINHMSLTSDKTGGIQVQLWEYGVAGGASTTVDTPVLSVKGETITWTQRMTVSNGALKLEVVRGSSATYGNFGKPATELSTTDMQLLTMEGYSVVYVDGNYQKVDNTNLQAVAGVSTESLNAYDPQVSAAKSGVSFGSNMVGALTLKRVRKYTSNGSVIEDNKSRSVVLP